jgi:hypothetical protein
MAITIDDDLQAVLELLWIREAWLLDPAGPDLPPPLADSPAPRPELVRSAAPIAEWREAWPRVWAAVVEHAGSVRDPAIFDRLRDTAEGADERARLLRELVGPSWRDELGDEALTVEAEQWMDARYQDRVARWPVPLEERPERVALDALVPAWRRGLTNIVEIPCRGSFTRRIGAHALLVTAETRSDPARYREALAEFS